MATLSAFSPACQSAKFYFFSLYLWMTSLGHPFVLVSQLKWLKKQLQMVGELSPWVKLTASLTACSQNPHKYANLKGWRKGGMGFVTLSLESRSWADSWGLLTSHSGLLGKLQWENPPHNKKKQKPHEWCLRNEGWDCPCDLHVHRHTCANPHIWIYTYTYTTPTKVTM